MYGRGMAAVRIYVYGVNPAYTYAEGYGMTRTMSSARFVTRISAPLIMMVASLCMTGCADYQVRMPDSDPINERYQSATMNAYVWGM